MASATRRRPRPATGWGELVADVPREELMVLRLRHPNLLIAGTPAAAASALRGLRESFRPPLVTWRAGTTMALPSTAALQTLIIEEVGTLTGREQQRLLSWLRATAGSAQAVATTSLPLRRLVDQGAFDASLYYALNVIYLELPA